MIENKRFTLKYINEQDISANLYDNETFIASIGIGEELIIELLNSLNNENINIKNTIKEAYNSERTQIGKSVLKQLMENVL